MTYYDKDYFLGSPAGFDGTFTELDGELVYIVPPGKQGTVNVAIQYRDDDGNALVDENGNSLPSFTDTISVAAVEQDPTWTPLPTIESQPEVGTEVVITNGVATSPGNHTPVTQTYQWKEDGVDIIGATSSTYTPVTAGTTLSVFMEATNSESDTNSTLVTAPGVTLPDPTSSDIFDVDFTAMTSSTDVYIDDSTTADIDGITFGNYVEAGTVWKVGSGSSTSPYNTEVHLYKDTAATGNDFSAAMAGDISTLPTAWTMEGVVAEGANASNSDYGWLVACNSDGTAQVRAVINSNTGNLRIRTLISGSWTYQSTVSLSQAIDTDDQQFLRASYDGTTLTVTAWDGTDDTGTQLATASTTTLPTLSTYFGFLAATGSTDSTRSRSAFSMKLTDDS